MIKYLLPILLLTSCGNTIYRKCLSWETRLVMQYNPTLKMFMTTSNVVCTSYSQDLFVKYEDKEYILKEEK